MTGRMVPGGDAGLDHRLVEQLGDEVLTEQPHRAPVDRLGGIGVAVADQSGHAAEEVTGHDPAAVVGDAAILDRGRVPGGLNDLDVVEEEVHLHGSHGRRTAEEHGRLRRLPPSARRWYRVM